MEASVLPCMYHTVAKEDKRYLQCGMDHRRQPRDGPFIHAFCVSASRFPSKIHLERLKEIEYHHVYYQVRNSNEPARAWRMAQSMEHGEPWSFNNEPIIVRILIELMLDV